MHGVPVAIKEELDVAGRVTTFGGRGNTTPAAADAEVVRRLRAAGAVVVGKTNMPEFGQWPFTESVAHGITRNPWDTRRSPGGSSGGTAAAVAAGLVAVRARRRRRRLDPDPVGLLRALRPQAAARPRDDGAARARLVGAEHDRSADPVGAGQRRGLRRAARHAAGGPLERPGAGDVVHRGRRRGRSRRCGSAGRRSRSRPACGPTPSTSPRCTRPRTLLASLGHHVEEVDPGYPDPTTAFVPQFFAGVRTGVDGLEHPDRVERRTRETARLGPLGHPAGRASGRSGRASRSRARPTGSSSGATCCSPRRSRTGPRRSASWTAWAPCGPRSSRCR